MGSWLVETLSEHQGYSNRYLACNSKGFTWTYSVDDALRFARREDAYKITIAFNLPGEPREHSWM